MPAEPLRFLVTAGPTREHLDDVRYLSNASSGRMGHAVARAALAAGHRVTLVSGPVELAPPPAARLVEVVSAEEMREAVLAAFPDADVVVMTAAVADYRPEKRVSGKLKKTGEALRITLVPTPDILAELGGMKGDRILVGFALESERGEENAREKLVRKHLDLVVLDSPRAIGAQVSDFTILGADGRREHHMSVSKDFLAQRLVSLAAEARLI